MSTNFPRPKYIKQILPFMGKHVIKVLIWQRRVGKSFLLQSLITHLFDEKKLREDDYIMINKESSQRSHIKTHQDLEEACAWRTTVCIDEIQEIPQREIAVRSMRVAGKDIIITWSNATLLSGELTSSLSGRYVHIDVYPLDYREFCDFHQLDPHTAYEAYSQYGGMPYLKELWLTDFGMTYSKDVYDTIVLRDIIQRHHIRNITLFQQLIQFTAQTIGSPFSALSISNYLANQHISLSSKMIGEYITYAKQALFLHTIPRYDVVGKKLFENKQKIYRTDHGLRNSMFDLTIKDRDRILENIVCMNLISNGRTVYTGDIKDKEIDFIAEKKGEKIYVQVCYLLAHEQTIEREFGSLWMIKDNRPKYVISTDRSGGKPIDGIIHQNIVDFLLMICG